MNPRGIHILFQIKQTNRLHSTKHHNRKAQKNLDTSKKNFQYQSYELVEQDG